MKKIIEFDQVEKSYGSKQALKDLSFEVNEGEFIAFLGPNGAGKSTAISLILGQRFPSKGKISILGGKPTDRQVKARIGATPQDLDFPVHLKCREVVHWLAAHYPTEVVTKPRIEKLKQQLGLEEFWNQETGGLSGGERRRLGLMLALIADPELLVLDEPTTGMDVNSRRMMWDVIRETQKRGKTILLTTHYLDEIEELSDRVLVIDRGQLLFAGSVIEIKKRVEYKVVGLSLADDSLKQHPAVFNWQYTAQRAQFLTKDSDALIREIVQKNYAFTDLQIQPASLEEAFLALRKGP